MSTSIKMLHSVSFVAVMAMFTTPAFAQDEEGAASGGLSEIVVTAQKRDENLQKVPIAITAVEPQKLAQVGVTSVQDLPVAVPGLSMLNVGGVLTPRIRGVGTTATAPGAESPVAIYVDGVYYSFGGDVNIDTTDVAQISVLKGPQGTLFGRNATGGVVQFTTREPGDEFEVSVSTSIDNYLTSRSSLFVGGGLTDDLRASVSVAYATQGKGWGKNLFDNSDIHRIHHDMTLRGKLLYSSDRTDAKLIVDYNSQDNDIPLNFRPFPPESFPFPTGEAFDPNLGYGVTLPVKQSDRLWDSNNYTESLYEHDGGGGSLSVDHEFDFANLVSITAYRSTTARLKFTPGATSIRSFDLDIPESSKQFTQEIQLVSNGNGPFKWVAGTYYYWNKATAEPVTVSIYATPQSNPFIVTNRGRQTSNSVAAFAQGTYDVTPSTRVTAGLRYTYEKKKVWGLVGGAVIEDEISFKRPTWRLAIDQDLGENALIYVSYNRGFKSGGFSSSSPQNPPFEPESLDAYEAGLKSELFDRTVRFNVAGFYYKYTNIQVNRFRLVGETYNGDGAKIYGVDADLEAALTDQLTLNASVNWLNTKFMSFPDAQCSDPNLLGKPNFIFSCDATGNELPNSPDLTFVVGVDYDIPTSMGDFTLNVTESYNDGYYGEADNLLFQDSFHLLSASVSWQSNGPLGVRLWINNILNEAVANQFATVAQGYIASYSSAPRTFGATFSASF